MQTHAETGSRSSQLARCLPSELHGDKLMVPASHKGRGGGRGGHVGVPLMSALAARLRKASAGKAAHKPLLTRADGGPRRESDHRHSFERAARAAKLPAGRTIYALRHSSICEGAAAQRGNQSPG